MRIVEIRNTTNNSVYIEDLGIRLNGKNATAYVTELDASQSKSLKELGALVSISVKRSFNIWPFSKPLEKVSPTVAPLQESKPAPEKANIVYPLPNPPAPIVQNPAVTVSDPKLDRLIENVNQLVNVMQNFAKQINQPTSSVTTASSIINSVTLAAYKEPEPVFIPSRIIPENSSSRVSVKQESQDRPDIDDAAKNLKKLRGKK
jgi:hypothetical protein